MSIILVLFLMRYRALFMSSKCTFLGVYLSFLWLQCSNRAIARINMTTLEMEMWLFGVVFMVLD